MNCFKQSMAAALGISLTAFFVSPVAAQPLPTASPESVGFSSAGLARIDTFFAREIAAKQVPGAVVAIARDGKLIHYKAYGMLDNATSTPMPLDAIFNLASMTKIMATVGGLTLTEQGRLPLKSRLDSYYPVFAKMTVGEAKTEVAKPIFIHDLFRHTSGITYGGRGDSAVHKQYPSGSAPAAFKYSADEFMTHLSSLPLLYQPSTTWDYGFSTDVLGIVIEKVSGQRLNDFLRTAVWEKANMPDTTFNVPAEKRNRLARPQAKDPISGKDQKINILDAQPKFDCAGSCAFSTVGDYLRFGQMLLNGGALDGKRVLGPKTVALMTADHLGANIKNNVAGTEPHRDGYSFGLGVAVRVHDGLAAIPGSRGDYSWNGANGTSYWADPAERLVVVVGTVAPGEIRKYYREQMADLVYGAMTEVRAK